MYGAVCDDTVGFFAVLTKDEPDPPRIERPLRVEPRGERRCIRVRMVAAEHGQPPAPCTAMRREQCSRIDLEVPQPFVRDIFGRNTAFDRAIAPQQQPAGFFRCPRCAIGANFRKRLPCNSKHHANIAIQ